MTLSFCTFLYHWFSVLWHLYLFSHEAKCGYVYFGNQCSLMTLLLCYVYLAACPFVYQCLSVSVWHHLHACLSEWSIVSFHSFETCWYIFLTYCINILIMENPPNHQCLSRQLEKNCILSGGTYVYIEYQVGRLIEVGLGLGICRWGWLL